MNVKTKILAAAATLLPTIAFAQVPDTSYIDNWVGHLRGWLNTAIVVIMVVMTLVFLYNVFKFISTKDATKAKEYQGAMIRGLIGLFVAVSVWGIISLLGNVTGVRQSSGYQTTCPPGYSPAPGGGCR